MLIYGAVSAEHRVGSFKGTTEVSFFSLNRAFLPYSQSVIFYLFFILVQIHIIIYLRNKIT